MLKVELNELGFDKEILNFIDDVRTVFSKVAASESTSVTLDEWLNENIETVVKDNVFTNLSKRELYLFSLGVISNSLEEYLS